MAGFVIGLAVGCSAMMLIDLIYGLPQVRSLKKLQKEVLANLDAVDAEIARFSDAGVVFPPAAPDGGKEAK